MKKFKPRAFWISRDEILETMKRGEICTVTAAVRLLVPDMVFFKCSRYGYWGLKRADWPRRVARPRLRAVPQSAANSL